MAQGLQCFDANGNPTFDTADYLFRFIGMLDTGQTPGSLSVPAMTAQYGFGFFTKHTHVNLYCNAVVTVSDGVVSWFWPNDGGNPANRNPGYVFYGLRG